ncbi:unnamed protein product [Prorocentrum cordatum]|uniref:Uncharacterized protein n=1 Tax=Prorocentrum cordatum TaxID=2364126 RepID=A0ABN9ULQ1_9DINO|nr:unnamed protein product [Polarella glacialis]
MSWQRPQPLFWRLILSCEAADTATLDTSDSDIKAEVDARFDMARPALEGFVRAGRQGVRANLDGSTKAFRNCASHNSLGAGEGALPKSGREAKQKQKRRGRAAPDGSQPASTPVSAPSITSASTSSPENDPSASDLGCPAEERDEQEEQREAVPPNPNRSATQTDALCYECALTSPLGQWAYAAVLADELAHSAGIVSRTTAPAETSHTEFFDLAADDKSGQSADEAQNDSFSSMEETAADTALWAKEYTDRLGETGFLAEQVASLQHLDASSPEAEKAVHDLVAKLAIANGHAIDWEKFRENYPARSLQQSRVSRDYKAFFDSGYREYSHKTDAGTGCTFWNGRNDAKLCQERMAKVMRLFREKYPGLPACEELPPPPCDFDGWYTDSTGVKEFDWEPIHNPVNPTGLTKAAT